MLGINMVKSGNGDENGCLNNLKALSLAKSMSNIKDGTRTHKSNASIKANPTPCSDINTKGVTTQRIKSAYPCFKSIDSVYQIPDQRQ